MEKKTYENVSASIGAGRWRELDHAIFSFKK